MAVSDATNPETTTPKTDVEKIQSAFLRAFGKKGTVTRSTVGVNVDAIYGSEISIIYEVMHNTTTRIRLKRSGTGIRITFSLL